MEDILKYENRDQLYDFLIADFGMIKLEENFDEKNFGNFFIILSSNDFLLSYVNDRSYLTINIASKLEPSRRFDLSFVRDLIYNPDRINADERELENATRINELNSFLRKDFSRISDLFNDQNYQSTRKRIEEGLKKQFARKFPGL